VYGTVIKAFQCPSDASWPNAGKGGYSQNYGACSYAINFQALGLPSKVSGKEGEIYYDTAGYPRPSGDRQANMVNSFPDGAASTILFTEKYAQCNGVPQAWAYFAGNTWAYDFPSLTDVNYQQAPFIAYGPNGAGGGVGPGNGPGGVIGVCTGDAKWQTPSRYQDTCDPRKASTGHPNTINCVMADGSMRSFEQKVNSAVWWAFLTPDGRDLASTD
jgi:hypothetical protein